MNIFKTLSLVAVACALPLLQSCIADEELSTECDILSVSEDWLNEQPADFIVGDPVIKHSQPATITLRINPDKGNIHEMAPRFEVSEGATLYYNDHGTLVRYYPAAVHDFSEPQTYSVKSADGRFVKDYIVKLDPGNIEIEAQDFEDFAFVDEAQNYQVLNQPLPDGTGIYNNFWTSGNGGFKLTGMAESYTDYPTAFVKEGRNDSYCAKLVTRDAGIFGIHTRPMMPIAAGNLFVGDFNVNYAMQAPRAATRFGLRTKQGKPLTLEGYYKYTAADVVVNQSKEPIPGKRDKADIYAVLFEIEPGNMVQLNGDNILTSDRIVLMARIDEPGEPTEWTHFSEPFKEKNGKTFSWERLRNGGYAIAITMTSSRQGAYFEGAIGSTLWVDDLKVTWQYDE